MGRPAVQTEVEGGQPGGRRRVVASDGDCDAIARGPLERLPTRDSEVIERFSPILL